MTRRQWIHTSGMAALASAAQPLWADPDSRFDILIKNGEVRDAGRGFRQNADVGIKDGKVAAIETSIPAERGIDVVNAEGMYVTPGLVDLHTHVYHSLGFGIEADPLAATSGVTTWVDAGSFSHNQAGAFRKFIVEPAQSRIFGYVYLYPVTRNPDEDPVQYVRRNMRRTGEVVVENRDILIGVKFQVGSNMNGRWSLDFLKIARELCDKYELPLMAHVSFAPPETDQVMELLRAGDVLTHCFNTHAIGILDDAGKIRSSVKEARSRGVLFDVGHGAGSFNFEIARKALDQGFLPDSISTDVYTASINGPVYDMPTTLTKMQYLGMSLDDILVRATINPAKVVNRIPGMGTLAVGGPADIALLEIEDGDFQLIDSQRNTVNVAKRIVSRLTICRGRRVVAPV
ncbi:MAG: amidohydrolase/deacetylase family metallohydrolase [Acidobacteria bacterium]|nr:amidohydrolase/deacetylase family metallohydrolase [Acidobacteriota bacterium]